MLSLRTKSKLRILDFDLENKPLSYWGKDPTSEITSIASCWADDPSSMEVLMVGPLSMEEVLNTFLLRYMEAGIVTGHYIKGHDLPIINGALIERGMLQLPPKLTQDTYLDLKKRKGIPASQEYLVSLFGIGRKVHMTQHDWRQANRGGIEGYKLTLDRVEGDVADHMKLRLTLLEKGLLRPPKIWAP